MDIAKQLNMSGTLKTFLAEECGTELPISGGLGYGVEDAIIVETDDEIKGVDLEYRTIDAIMKKIGRRYAVRGQMLISQNGRFYDAIHIDMGWWRKHVFYFDITAFYNDEC